MTTEEEKEAYENADPFTCPDCGHTLGQQIPHWCDHCLCEIMPEDLGIPADVAAVSGWSPRLAAAAAAIVTRSKVTTALTAHIRGRVFYIGTHYTGRGWGIIVLENNLPYIRDTWEYETAPVALSEALRTTIETLDEEDEVRAES